MVEVLLVQHTGGVQVAVMTSWAPVVLGRALAVLREDDNVLIIGFKSLWERLLLAVMIILRADVLNRSSDDVDILSADQVPPVALNKRTVEVDLRRMAQIGLSTRSGRPDHQNP